MEESFEYLDNILRDSQMTSKCSKNKKETRGVIAECVTDVLTTHANLHELFL